MAFGAALLSALAGAPEAYQQTRGRQLALNAKESDQFANAALANAAQIWSQSPAGGGGTAGGASPVNYAAMGGVGGGPGAGGPQPTPPGQASQLGGGAPPMPQPMPQGGAPLPPAQFVNPRQVNGQAQNIGGDIVPPGGTNAQRPGGMMPVPLPPGMAPGGGPPSPAARPPAAPPGMSPSAGGMPPKLQDRMPMGGGQQPGMQQGQMDWRQMLQAIFKANPGISPQIAGMAVTKALPLMNMASKQEWLMAHNQFLQQQLEARERMLQERERGLGDRLTQRGQQAQGLEGTKQQGRMNLQDKRGDQASDRQQDQQEFQAEQGALTRGSREGIAAANRAARPNSIEPSDAAIDAVGNYKRPPPLRSDKNFWNKLAAKYPDYDEKIWENSQSGARAEGRTSGGRIGGLNVVLDALEAAVQPALERSKTVSRQGFVPLDKIIQGGQIITNDTELNRFGVANLQLAELWAKAMNPGGVMRVDDRNKALEFLSTAKSQEAYEANVNQIVSQIRRERDSIQAGRQKVLNPMGAKETEGAPSPKSKEEYDALPSGTEFTDPQGVKRRKP